MSSGEDASFTKRVEPPSLAGGRTWGQRAARLGTGLQNAARHSLPVLQLGARRLLGRKSPFQMTLSLTNRCNFRCDYCHIPLQVREELSTGEWLAAIDELHAGGMGRASLIGGEPLLRKDAGTIIRHLRRRGVHVSMNTNGWFIPDRIEECAQLDLACITLDGPEEVHDRQRHKGSYARVLKAIDELRRRDIPVVTMSVVTAASIDHLDHVLDVAAAHGIRAYFQLEHDAAMDVDRPVAPAISQSRVAQMAAHLRQRKQEGLPVGNSYEVLDHQAAERYLVTCDHCWAGTYYGYVFSDGTVSHCLLTQGQVERSNGRERGVLRAFQELAPPTGQGCSCVPSHEVNHALDLDPRVLFGALDIALKSAWQASTHGG
jgi:MoaA/NifB/PqqE/SkfB family radical SAM enzyme